MTHIDHGGTWHEASFRLVETYDVTVDAQWRIDLDHQPYGEIVHVLSGCCRFVQGDRSADVGPGDLGILLPGQDRSTQAVGGAPLSFTGFGFRVELHGAVELSGLLGLPLHLPTPDLTTLGLVTQAVRSGRPTSPGAALRARGYAELATAELVERHGTVGALAGAGGSGRRPEIEAALGLMERDLSGDLDVATLARTANLSPKHFARCFKDVVGVPPMTYLQALRLGRARAALATTRRTALAIAVEHGFADAAHFSRAFKRTYGLTPTSFRRLSAASGGGAGSDPGALQAPHLWATG
ncbi:helix-turn-helix domain-containing protein [Streptomyces sp. NPDC005248]|uniref:helix-turn-helix domain-containing protein n=1 Tax=unclassified Streptomyces TaxID=2593676 RepID=UPI00367C74C1